MQGAIVLEHRQPWFRIRLNDGSAWVRASNPAHFHSLESLLQDGLVSLTDAWDGTLAASPGGPLLPVPHHPNRQVIGYLTPVLTLVEIPVGPGENAEDIRKRHPGIGMGSVSGRDGVIRLLYYHHGREVEARARPDRQAPVVERFINDHARLQRGRDGTSPLPVFVFDRVPGAGFRLRAAARGCGRGSSRNGCGSKTQGRGSSRSSPIRVSVRNSPARPGAKLDK